MSLLKQEFILDISDDCGTCDTCIKACPTDALEENNISAEVKKVEDIVDIMNYGVMATPGLVINEKLVLSGRLPSKSEINKLVIENIHR